MDVREKLVELLFKCAPKNIKLKWRGEKIEVAISQGNIADYLIDNGVTVQEWISVKGRLPEKNTSVIASTDKGIVFQCLYAYDGWDLWDGNEVNITHWQPMPQPPKGE